MIDGPNMLHTSLTFRCKYSVAHTACQIKQIQIIYQPWEIFSSTPPSRGYRQLLCKGDVLMSNDYSVNDILGEQPNKSSSSKF